MEPSPESREAHVSIDNLSLICIPFTLEPIPVPYPKDEPRSNRCDRAGEHAANDAFDLRWAGAAAG